MRNKIIGLALCALLLALSSVAETQQPKKVYRIGYLSTLDSASESARSEAIRRALRELGYTEGLENKLLKDRTSLPSTDMLGGSPISSLSLRPSWCVSRLISS